MLTMNAEDSATEMTRLLLLDRILVTMMGGLLPEQAEARFKEVRSILDIGCGLGS